jgi:hypothetical protein
VGAAPFAQFIAGGSGGRGECGDFNPDNISRPTIRVPGAYDDGSGPDVGVTSIGQVKVFYFFRFETGIPISVSVTSPTGTVKRLEGCAPCESNPPWYALPGDPLGTYQVIAVQGSLKATGGSLCAPLKTAH